MVSTETAAFIIHSIIVYQDLPTTHVHHSGISIQAHGEVTSDITVMSLWRHISPTWLFIIFRLTTKQHQSFTLVMGIHHSPVLAKRDNNA